MENNLDSARLNQLLLRINHQFPVVCFLNSNSNHIISGTKSGDDGFDWILAAGVHSSCVGTGNDNLHHLKKFLKRIHPGRNAAKPWIFGFLSYDLKNEIENLVSENPDRVHIPPMHFFIPALVVTSHINEIKIFRHGEESELISFDQLLNLFPPVANRNAQNAASSTTILKPRISKKRYLEIIKKIKQHIYRGDLYEMNFCLEFYAEKVVIDPLQTYLRLNNHSPMPFSCYYKLHDKYLLCSSPERFIKMTGNKIISQPIKGTAKRGKNKNEDKGIIKMLANDKKEQSENVMIVDLVRNDLSRIARDGSVTVEELFGIYSYDHVHQMVSTISCTPGTSIDLVDIIKNTFPMGSMTGAPKVKAMELIEKFESSRRGLYSGALGYISPEGEFDFNVVIRSLLYNKKTGYISAMAGSAITAGCDARKEYDECLLKAEPMQRALV